MSTNPSNSDTPHTDKWSQASASATREKSSKFNLGWFIIIPALFAVIFLTLYFVNFNGSFGNQGDFGTFGDFIGGTLNPILGFATVFLLVLSLRKQSKELTLSREELALTRQELSETKQEAALSRRAMEEQVNHLKQEAKLNEFVRMLSDLRSQFLNCTNKSADMNAEVKHSLLKTCEAFKIRPKAQYTIEELVYNSPYHCAQNNEKVRKALYSHFQNTQSKKQHSQWHDLENIITGYAAIAVGYYDISEQKHLAILYLDEATRMIKPFNDIFGTKKSLNALTEIGYRTSPLFFQALDS
ncbi:hypothetical protein [Shewanella algae]|uniref:hypothetical protein n=1 Tax=Shewanella algae TaxID=38313 RepID=UPI0031F5007A